MIKFFFQIVLLLIPAEVLAIPYETTPIEGTVVEYGDPSIPHFPARPPQMEESLWNGRREWAAAAIHQARLHTSTPETTKHPLPFGFERIMALSTKSVREGMLMWYGCDSRSLIQGGGQASTAWPPSPRCNPSYLNPDFARQLSKYLLSCLQEGARHASVPEPTSVFVMHASTYRPNAMLHGSARAMDLTFVNFRNEDGEVYFTFDTHKPSMVRMAEERKRIAVQNRVLYDRFRSCWKKNLPIRGCNPYTGGSIGYDGATPVAFNRADHNDHIHLELAPDCGRVQ